VTAFDQPGTDRCHRCWSSAVAPIVYGLPDRELEKAGMRGDVVLGGCMVSPPEWACMACGYSWPLPPEALESEPVDSALTLAYMAHRDQVRKGDGSPYIRHPIEVAHILFETVCNPQVTAAGLLHDAIEDGGLTAGEIADEVGAPVATLVETLTEDKEIRDYDRRKLEHRARVARAGLSAAAIYAADKFANLRAQREAHAREGERVARRFNASLDVKLANTERDLRMLRRVGLGPPLAAELESELVLMRAQRTARRRARRVRRVS
jgi:hypothetical protein